MVPDGLPARFFPLSNRSSGQEQQPSQRWPAGIQRQMCAETYGPRQEGGGAQGERRPAVCPAPRCSSAVISSRSGPTIDAAERESRVTADPPLSAAEVLNSKGTKTHGAPHVAAGAKG
ncbi:hypothetical protein EYF80_046452 [Liparis tanakae]|uniref:Uncharacterized protein n=1 Tax=Liparis tanakae TaxID=230148 RepID=A0A4Z2FRM5_9TELE|nr:hypothetical protein EYF80_046452 [Liparis tanakae]